MNDSLKLLKALADKTRLFIINTLASKPAYLEELAERLDLAPSTVSFHLKKLTEVHLVKKKKQQYYVEFEINEIVLQQSLWEIVMRENPNLTQEENRLQEYNQKILDTFYKDGTLLKLPKQLKKRLVVLHHIAKDFQPNVRYPERQVNNIIQRHYKDYCYIRREMIDFMIMQRKNGEYWLNLTKEENKMRQQELKKIYKETPRDGGIFQIRNKETGKRLLGKSADIEKAFNKHKAQLKFGTHRSKALQQDFNEHGMAHFSFEVLTVLERKDETDQQMWKELEALEELWIEKLALSDDMFYKLK